jgi:FdrA protein
VIVLISKPPDPAVAARLLAAARASDKPVVVWLLGAAPPARRMRNLWFAVGSDEAAELAVELAAGVAPSAAAGGDELRGATDPGAAPRPESAGRLRGFFAGGTLAAEVMVGLTPFLAPLASNLSLPGALPLPGPGDAFAGHSVVDLGADELTAGRPHPMLEPSLLAERLAAAGADPATGLLLFDVVLGDGAHADPAGELAPAVAGALAAARAAGRPLEAVAILVGTEADPQGRGEQAERLAAAGARVTGGVAEALRYAVSALPTPLEDVAAPVPLSVLAEPFAAVNVGLSSFAAALADQGADVVHVDWRPPAGGDERLAGILARSRGLGSRGDR